MKNYARIIISIFILLPIVPQFGLSKGHGLDTLPRVDSIDVPHFDTSTKELTLLPAHYLNLANLVFGYEMQIKDYKGAHQVRDTLDKVRLNQLGKYAERDAKQDSLIENLQVKVLRFEVITDNYRSIMFDREKVWNITENRYQKLIKREKRKFTLIRDFKDFMTKLLIAGVGVLVGAAAN